MFPLTWTLKLAALIRRLITAPAHFHDFEQAYACTAKGKKSTDIRYHHNVYVNSDTNVVECLGCGRIWDPR